MRTMRVDDEACTSACSSGASTITSEGGAVRRTRSVRVWSGCTSSAKVLVFPSRHGWRRRWQRVLTCLVDEFLGIARERTEGGTDAANDAEAFHDFLDTVGDG